MVGLGLYNMQGTGGGLVVVGLPVTKSSSVLGMQGCNVGIGDAGASIAGFVVWLLVVGLPVTKSSSVVVMRGFHVGIGGVGASVPGWGCDDAVFLGHAAWRCCSLISQSVSDCLADGVVAACVRKGRHVLWCAGALPIGFARAVCALNCGNTGVCMRGSALLCVFFCQCHWPGVCVTDPDPILAAVGDSKLFFVLAQQAAETA
jgi:hypothetical protein